MIVGLMSTYREGRLVREAVRSALRACDYVIVADGPVSDGGAREGDESDYIGVFDYAGFAVSPARAGRLYTSPTQGWESDAAKRTWLLRRTRLYWGSQPRAQDERLWCLWLDGDEVVLWPELLADWLERAAAEENAVGGVGLRLVELDGSVSLSVGRVFDGHAIERFDVAAYQAVLKGGMVVALPNVPLCSSGGIPLDPFAPGEERTPQTQDRWLARYRPPLQGEPHILHRSGLRRPGRDRERMHEAEADWFRRLGSVQEIESRLNG